MDNLTGIKEKLDSIYKEYKDNKSQLNGEKTRMAAKLIVEMTFSNNVNPADVALELSRFSADVVNVYFESLTKSANIPLEVLDEVLKELYATDKDAKLSQYYVSKYAFAITSIIKNYKENALKSAQLPLLVAFIARFAVQSGRSKEKFQRLINNTSGGIYMLDYNSVKRNSLTNIWNATKAVFPDLSKAKYESFISDWGKKYGFIQDTANNAPETSEQTENVEEVVAPNEKSEEAPKSAEVTDTKAETNVAPVTDDEAVAAHTDTVEKSDAKLPVVSNEDTKTMIEKTVADTTDNANTASVAVPEKARSGKSSVQILYDRLKWDMDKEQEAIITAFTDMITPVGKAFESIQGEISKSREIGAENVTLKAKITDLDRQLSEQRDRLQTANQSLAAVRTENDELKKQISSLEAQNAELDSKLNDAYAINSRESSLEAEKIRSELKKAFAFLYEDWLEYEFSDVSEENYESLQAIIKKIFRSLERNGIDFKGNN